MTTLLITMAIIAAFLLCMLTIGGRMSAKKKEMDDIMRAEMRKHIRNEAKKLKQNGLINSELDYIYGAEAARKFMEEL